MPSLRAQIFPEETFQNLFTKFVQDYNKQYEASEFFQRYSIFKTNLELIVKTNMGNESFTLGMNEFGDLTFDEFKKTHFGLKPRPARADYYMTAPVDVSSLPASVDWTTKGVVTPIKNQGQCGSCWAFSATGSIEGAHAIKTGNLISLSEQELVDCAGAYGNQGCAGGLMDDAFQYVVAKGLCKETDYPYTGKNGNCKASSCTAAVTISGFKDVPPNDESALQAAAANQPISVAIEADQSVFQFYKSGVITSAGCGTALDHGVLVVGYGTESGTDYWKVKNSWGASWGMSGYVLIKRGSDECGIAKQPSYPIA